MHKMLCVGEIVNTHGVRGELKVIPLVDNPDDLLDYSYYFIDDKKRIIRFIYGTIVEYYSEYLKENQ